MGDNENARVVKNTLHAGQKYIPIANGSKVLFHFQTWKIGKERVLIDDSRKMGKKEPMVLVIGNKFKLEVWENIVKLMAVGEVASFKVKKELLISYPFVSKTLRDLHKDSCTKKHSCAMTLQTEGLGYADLDELMSQPSDLEFIIELLQVEKDNEYEKDIWQLNLKERLDLIPVLREKGNSLYSQKLYEEAEEAYYRALAVLEQLMMRERKCDEEWATLNSMKLPILLNYAQCKLMKGDFYTVIQHCNTVLEHDTDNQKALFRRAKAHVGAWNLDEAEADLNRLRTINPSMTQTVDKELKNIKNLRKGKLEQERDAMTRLFQSDKEKT